FIRCQTEPRKIGGVDFPIGIRGIKCGGDSGFPGAGGRVALRARAATREHDKRKILVCWFSDAGPGVEQKLRLALVRGEIPVGEQAAFVLPIVTRCCRRQGPLDSASVIKVLVILDAGDVEWLVGGKTLEDLKRGFG